MGITNRILKICELKKIRNNDLVKLGYGSKQTISNILNGKQNPGIQFIEKFLKEFSDINARWLMTGEVDHVIEDPKEQYGFCKECIKKEGIIEHMRKECNAKDKRIEELLIKIAGAERGVKSQAAPGRKAS